MVHFPSVCSRKELEQRRHLVFAALSNKTMQPSSFSLTPERGEMIMIMPLGGALQMLADLVPSSL
jgi:hypothetical protein